MTASAADRCGGTTARRCPLCGGSNAKLIAGPQSYPWARCGACDTTYVTDEVSPDMLTAHYAQHYAADSTQIPPVVVQRLAETVRGFEPFRDNNRLLDVGYGAGTLLDAAHAQGWECWGTEISSSALERAAGRGWQQLAGDLRDVRLPPQHFDVVSMVELLEHVPDPIAQLRAAAGLLRPGGLLYATTPNGRGLSGRALGLRWSAFTAPEHLQLFAPAGLRRKLGTLGFRDVKLMTTGVNPYELVSGLRTSTEVVSPHDRVATGYELNTKLSGSPSGTLVRNGVNALLTATRLGDSIKLWAVHRVGG